MKKDIFQGFSALVIWISWLAAQGCTWYFGGQLIIKNTIQFELQGLKVQKRFSSYEMTGL